MIEFGSQVNILSKDTWVKMGRPSLVRSRNFLKLVDQIFIDPIKLLKGTKSNVMGIVTIVDSRL
jgi:hypothetical protein